MTYPLMTSQHEPTELERWWDAFDAQAHEHTAEAHAFYQLGLTAGQAANWANAGFSAAETEAWTAAGFAPSEADLASWYREAGHEEPAEAYVASLADTTAGMVDEAERIEERAATAQNEALMDHDHLEHGTTGADCDYTDADEMRAAGHPAAQAADYEPDGLRDALAADDADGYLDEGDADVIGTEAHAAHYWENGGEYSDGSHDREQLDGDEDVDMGGYPADGPEPDGRGDHVLDGDASTWAQDAARYQADTLEYAIGDDLVIGGVAYNSDQWEADGEGGVQPRQALDAAGAAPFHDDYADADCDGF